MATDSRPAVVLLAVIQDDRAAMVGQLFAAADALGIDRADVKSQSIGFLIPMPIAAYLFPSTYG